jgi:thioredoxin-dependent peroxiredoxin
MNSLRLSPLRLSLLAATCLIALPALSQTTPAISKENAVALGEGANVSMRGRPVALAGQPIEVGKPLPKAMVTGTNMAAVDIAGAKGKVRILNIVPSLDTATCEEQTHQLSETNEGLDKQVELVTLSMDLPFAQRRFATTAKINNVTFFSDYRGQQFGMSTGLLQKTSMLLSRAVVVVDRENIVRYIQAVPDLSTIPDMQAAFKAARELL